MTALCTLPLRFDRLETTETSSPFDLQRRVLRNWDAASLQSLDVKSLRSRLQQVHASFTNLNRHHARSQRVQRHLTIRRGLLRRAFFHHEDVMADHAISTEVK